jgi:hypothetical protein
MATGDTTATVVGVYTSDTLKAAIDAQNVGAATAGTETATLHLVPVGTGQILLVKIARAA